MEAVTLGLIVGSAGFFPTDCVRPAFGSQPSHQETRSLGGWKASRTRECVKMLGQHEIRRRAGEPAQSR
jgi:hypothetical protein